MRIRDLFDFGSGMKDPDLGFEISDLNTAYKTVEIKVFLNFLLADKRIRIHSNNSRGPKTYGSYGIPDP
jgi:hypothetical protein